MKKDLANITKEEVLTICEIYNEPFLDFMAGRWTYGLAVQINTTSTSNGHRFDSYITIFYDGKIELSRNGGGWSGRANGMRNEDINPLIAIDYLRSLGYEFKYDLPIKLERKIKLNNINEK